MKRITFILIAVAICSGLFAQSTVKGYVYQDNNKNGKRDGGEKGIANVAVSNGTEVVLTDSKGVYELPVALDNIIFVVKPAGYSFQMDGNNLPRFYYIYKPKGSPQTFYKGSAPTGQLPKSLDFALNRTSETDNFKALILAIPSLMILHR